MKQKVLWFTVGFTSAVAAVTALVVFKDLWFDRETISSHLKVNVDTIDIKLSNLEPALNGLRPNSNLISLNVSVGNGVHHNGS